MAVGSLRAVTIDVNDLEEGERFWTGVTGLPVSLRRWNGQYSRLGAAGEGSILLQLVPEEKRGGKNRVHLDFTVDEVDEAIAAVLALGGSLERGRQAYPESGTQAREYAVVKDPFGNEFCLVRELLPDSASDIRRERIRPRHATTEK
jgi:catechol 2,3-dioxygenase-like lactoylglutathione lyase family enzyme